MSNLENIIAQNLIYLRKNAGLTQLEFGEKFNYSDKTVSKWELGSVIPSVDVLKEIADFYGVSLDYIVTEHHNQKEFKSSIKKTPKAKEKFILIAIVDIAILAVAVVIYCAGFINNGSSSPSNNTYWPVLVWFVPVALLVSSILCSKYFGHRFWVYILYSLVIWTILIAVYFTFLSGNLWFLFFAGIPFQALVILIYYFRKKA